MSTKSAVGKLLGQDGNIIVPKAFADLMDGLDGGAVLTDLAVWQANHGDWFWRTDVLIAERQHVSPYATKNARAKLMAAGLLEMRMQGQPAKAHYKLDMDAVLALACAETVEPLRARPPEMIGASPGESGGALLLKREVKNTESNDSGRDANGAPVNGGAKASSPVNKRAARPAAGKVAQADIQAMVDTMALARGYPPANYARHVKAAKRLILAGRTPADVEQTVAYIRRECRNMDGQPVTMETVSKYIGLACPPSRAPSEGDALRALPDWVVDGAAA